MNVALIAVGAAAACSGTAAVLQAAALRDVPHTPINAGFIGGLIRNPRYLLALVLVAAGFGLSILALRSLPLFVVQAGRASSLAITAVLSVLTLGARLRWAEVAGVLAVGAGLVLVAVAGGPQGSAEVGLGARFALLTATALIAVAARAALRMDRQEHAGLMLALLAGCSFGLLAVNARLIDGFAPLDLITDPIGWAMAVSGLLGLLLGALALQRATVVAVTSSMVATETILGAALGVVVCSDRPEPGMTPAAVAGFIAVLGGALVLARFGAPTARDVT